MHNSMITNRMEMTADTVEPEDTSSSLPALEIGSAAGATSSASVLWRHSMCPPALLSASRAQVVTFSKWQSWSFHLWRSLSLPSLQCLEDGHHMQPNSDVSARLAQESQDVWATQVGLALKTATVRVFMSTFSMLILL